MVTTLSRITEGKLIGIVAIIIVGAISIGSVGWYLQTADADITNASKAEMFNFMKDTYVSQKQAGNDLVLNIERDNTLRDRVITLESDVQKSILDIRQELGQLRIDIAILKAGGTSSSGSLSDFDLMSCADYNCTDETQRFSQGDVLYVRGQNPSNDRSLNYKVYDSDSVRQDSRQVSLQPNGPFIIAYTIPSDAFDGAYKLIVEIDNEEDQINFIVD